MQMIHGQPVTKARVFHHTSQCLASRMHQLTLERPRIRDCRPKQIPFGRNASVVRLLKKALRRPPILTIRYRLDTGKFAAFDAAAEPLDRQRMDAVDSESTCAIMLVSYAFTGSRHVANAVGGGI